MEEELERLEAAGIIEPVTHSDWAAPVVPVVKGDDNIRLCGDYKLTVNQVASLEKYPLPLIEDMILSLGKGKVFTKLDLANAYLQVELEQESKKSLHTKACSNITDCLLVWLQLLPYFNTQWKTSCKAFQMYWCTWMISWWQDHRRQSTCSY